MADQQQVLEYFKSLGIAYSELKPGMWMIQDVSGTVRNIVVHLDPPLLVLRVKLIDLGEGGNYTELYRKLLQLNGSEMIHGAYALEENTVVAVDALQSETLDEQELQASIDSLSFAASTHLPQLKALLA